MIVIEIDLVGPAHCSFGQRFLHAGWFQPFDQTQFARDVLAVSCQTSKTVSQSFSWTANLFGLSSRISRRSAGLSMSDDPLGV